MSDYETKHDKCRDHTAETGPTKIGGGRIIHHGSSMIFTEEQMDRLPGSTVRLKNYPNHLVVVGELNQKYAAFASFHLAPEMRPSVDPVCWANTAAGHTSGTEIVEVIQWADEKQKPQPAVSGNITTSTTMGVHTFAGVKTAPKQARKVVQISNAEHDIAALCDDGTVWVGTDRGWVKLPPIPQDEDENQQEDF